ncbi:putative ABC transporter ATP-binding protein [Staphylococcus aureus]|nr:putative ABC transporter ATP-binding protein [Staphylococcus aureus]
MLNLLNKLKREGKLILIVHHDIHKAKRYFDKIILLNQSLIQFGPSHDVLTEENIKQTFLYGGVNNE